MTKCQSDFCQNEKSQSEKYQNETGQSEKKKKNENGIRQIQNFQAFLVSSSKNA